MQSGKQFAHLKNIWPYFLLLVLISCERRKCPPCTDCNTTVKYQVVKTTSDTLLISYREVDSFHYEECSLIGGYLTRDTMFVVPGTYNIDAKGFIGGEASISGESRGKEWILKILSPLGAVLASTENQPFKEYAPRPTIIFYSNSLIIPYP